MSPILKEQSSWWVQFWKSKAHDESNSEGAKLMMSLILKEQSSWWVQFWRSNAHDESNLKEQSSWRVQFWKSKAHDESDLKEQSSWWVEFWRSKAHDESNSEGATLMMSDAFSDFGMPHTPCCMYTWIQYVVLMGLSSHPEFNAFGMQAMLAVESASLCTRWFRVCTQEKYADLAC